MAKAQKGSFMNAILDQNKPKDMNLQGQNTRDTNSTYNTHVAENTHDTLLANSNDTKEHNGGGKRKLTRLNLALDSKLLIEMEDLAFVKGKKNVTALITEVMRKEIALNSQKIAAYRKIREE